MRGLGRMEMGTVKGARVHRSREESREISIYESVLGRLRLVGSWWHGPKGRGGGEVLMA